MSGRSGIRVGTILATRVRRRDILSSRMGDSPTLSVWDFRLEYISCEWLDIRPAVHIMTSCVAGNHSPALTQWRLTMSTKLKSNATMAVEINQSANTIIFTVRDAGAITLDMSRLSPDVIAYAAFHGMKQRIADAAAMSRNPDTGAPASPQDKFDAMQALAEHYMSGTGEWAVRVASGGAGKPSGLTLRALADVQGLDVPAMRERVEGLAERKGTTTAALLRELAKAPAVAKRIAELKAASSPDADSLLDELA